MKHQCAEWWYFQERVQFNLGMNFTCTTPEWDKNFYHKQKPRISLSGMQKKKKKKKKKSAIFTSVDKFFLAYPTGISMNPTGARKCRLIRGGVRCEFKIPSTRITVRHHSASLAMRKVTLVTEFSIRISQPLKIQPGAVARLEASSLGMQAAPSSIPTSGTFFRGDLVMKTFLRPFSLFRWFKKSSCQLLAKECALSTGKLPRRLAQEWCG